MKFPYKQKDKSYFEARSTFLKYRQTLENKLSVTLQAFLWLQLMLVRQVNILKFCATKLLEYIGILMMHINKTKFDVFLLQYSP